MSNPTPLAARAISPNTEPDDTSFFKSVFSGDILEQFIFPYPALKDEESETIAAVLETVEKFFKDHVKSTPIDREGAIPKEVLEGLKELGLFGLIIPEEFGGLGLSVTAYCKIVERIAMLDPSIAVTLGAHQSIGMKALLLFGSDAQKKKYLPDLATGKMIAAYALTEPSSGSDAYSIKSRAVLSDDGSHYVLNGNKIWITNGGFADFFTVFAKTPMEIKDAKTGENKIVEKVNGFFVTRDMGGVTNGPEEDKMGIRGSSTTQIYFDNVKVPKENLIGENGKGFYVAMEILNSGRLGLAAGCVGASKLMIERAVDHAKTRQQFGKPIFEFGMIKEKLGLMTIDTYVIESMVYLTTHFADRGLEDYSLESAMCKVYGSEFCWNTVHETLQIQGGTGYMKEYPYEQAMRDARINLIFEGTNEILRCFVALSGMKGVGDYLKVIGKALNDPIKSLGVLRNFAVRKITKTITRDRLSLAHPLLQPEAMMVEDRVAGFAEAVEMLLRRHGKDIVNREFAQKRIAECAMDIFAMMATLSRVTAAIGKKGEEEASEEINICKTFCERANKRVSHNIRRLDKNDDENIKEISSYVGNTGKYHYGF